MCSPGPRSMRKRMSQPVVEEDEDLVILEDDLQDDGEEEEPGPSNRPYTARRRRVERDDGGGGGRASQPASQGPAASRPPKHAGSRKASQRTPHAGNATVQIQYSQAEVDQLTQQIQRYKDAASKVESESNVSLTSLEIESLVGRVVRYMLFSQHDKPGHPVTRTKLGEIVTADHKQHKHARHLLSRVLPEAQFRLLNVFGIEMREVERVSEKKSRGADAGAAATTSGVIEYVLRNRLPTALREEVLGTAGGGGGAGVNRALTMVVLAMIHVEGGKMEEGALWKWLSELGIAQNSSRDSVHPVLGKVEDELSKLESARWLLRNKVARGSDGAQEVVYEWGEAARDEISESEIKEFIEQQFHKQTQRAVQHPQQHSQQQQQGDEGPEVIEISD